MADRTAAIVGGLKTIISAIAAVDQFSTDDYLPPINTIDTALVIPAFGQETETARMGMDGSRYQAHKFRCELWVKHTGNNANLTQRARAVGSAAIEAILASPTLGGVVDTVGFFDGRRFDYLIRSETANEMIEVGGIPYLVVTIIVPVTDLTPTS